MIIHATVMKMIMFMMITAFILPSSVFSVRNSWSATEQALLQPVKHNEDNNFNNDNEFLDTYNDNPHLADEPEGTPPKQVLHQSNTDSSSSTHTQITHVSNSAFIN